MNTIVYILIGVCTLGMMFSPLSRVVIGVIRMKNPQSRFNDVAYRKKIQWRNLLIGIAISAIGLLGIFILSKTAGG